MIQTFGVMYNFFVGVTLLFMYVQNKVQINIGWSLWEESRFKFSLPLIIEKKKRERENKLNKTIMTLCKRLYLNTTILVCHISFVQIKKIGLTHPIKPSLNTLFFFFFFLKYDKNSNLNSHTHIFWRFWGLNQHPHRGVRLFGEGDYHWAEYPSGIKYPIYNNNISKYKTHIHTANKETARDAVRVKN